MSEEKALQEKILDIRRVSRKVPGGNYVSFSVLVAVGDGEGGLGIGLAKALEVPRAINKAIARAKKRIISIKLTGSTIPHDLNVKYNAAKIILKPAPRGTGLKVGSVLRPIMEIAGVKDLSGKIYGSNNKINLTYAIYEVFKKFARNQN